MVVVESDPACEISGDGKDIAEDIDLEFVEVLIDGGIQECLELLQSLFDLLPRRREVGLAIFAGAWLEAKSLRRSGDQSSLETTDALIDEVVD